MDYQHNWISTYYAKYEAFMQQHYPELLAKFYNNIHPPQYVGGGIGLSRSARHTDKEYDEMMQITKEFCQKNPDPFNISDFNSKSK